MLIRNLFATVIAIIWVLMLIVSPRAENRGTTIDVNRLKVSSQSFFQNQTLFSSTEDMVSSSSSLFHSKYLASSRQSFGTEEGNKVPETSKPAQKELQLDLQDLTDIALKRNNLLEIVRQQRQQSKGRLTQARSTYLPHLTLEARYSYIERKDSAQITESSEESDEKETDDVVLGTANVSQLIYDFGKTTSAIKIGKKNLAAAEAMLHRQIQDIVFEVQVAYYNVLEKKRLIDVAAEAVNSFRKHLNRAKLYLKTGVRTKIDVINAEVELSNANMNLLGAEYELKNAFVALEQILGTKPNMGNYSLYNEDVAFDEIFETMPQPPDDLGVLIREGLEYRPDIIQHIQLMKAAEANYKRVTGDYWPSISAQANYSDYDTNLSLYKDSWEVGLVASWNIFSGLHTKGSRAEAKGGVLENRARLQNLQLTIRRDVTENYLSSIENRKRVQIALQTLEFAKQSVLLAEKRYKSGITDAIEYNDAQLNLTRTRNDLVVTYYSYLIALAGIEHATGKISGVYR